MRAGADLIRELLRRFPDTPLPNKVLIAGILYTAANGLDPEFMENVAKAWATAVKLEVEFEKIVDLYVKGLADYTGLLHQYSDVVKFVVSTMGSAIRAMKGGGSS